MRKERIVNKESVKAVARVEIFEPLMCCSSGVCGPVQDQTLLDFVETVRSLEADGVQIARYQPGSNPTAFKNNAEVMQAVRTRNMSALPITIVNGRVLKSGAYPFLCEIRDALNCGAR